MFAPALVTNADGTVTANPDGGIPFNEDVTIALPFVYLVSWVFDPATR